jgi:hypothetical protein
VFIGSCNGLVRRIDRATAAVRWETNVRGAVTGRYNFHGDVFIAPDRIVASADTPPGPNAEAGVHALDLESGRELWRERIGRGVAGAVTGTATRVFVYTIPGDLLALDLASGRREWTVPMKASAWDRPNARYSSPSGTSMIVKEFRIDWTQAVQIPQRLAFDVHHPGPIEVVLNRWENIGDWEWLLLDLKDGDEVALSHMGCGAARTTNRCDSRAEHLPVRLTADSPGGRRYVLRVATESGSVSRVHILVRHPS